MKPFDEKWALKVSKFEISITGLLIDMTKNDINIEVFALLIVQFDLSPLTCLKNITKLGRQLSIPFNVIYKIAKME